MINPKTKLSVLHDDNSVFTDHSESAADYIRDDFSLDLSSTEDYLYLGYSKPFSASYAALTTANTNANTLAAEYWDGDSWESLDLTDESKGLTRSGFLFWTKPSDWASTSVNSESAYWIRLRPSADHSATDVRGVNIVYSDDTMLKSEFFEIDNSNLLPPGENSHITKHTSARNEIVQRLTNMGYLTIDASNTQDSLDQWDLIDIFEVRQASTYLALSKIFFNLSDSIDDHWWNQYLSYKAKYEEAFKLSVLSIDSDNDGIDEDDEVQAPMRVFRWKR